VLDGAKALAVPTRFGQSLEVVALETTEPCLHWQSLDDRKNIWFEARFQLPGLAILETTDAQTAQKLLEILQFARRQNSEFLQQKQTLSVTTTLTFPRQWGLGTSSTLVFNIAKWAGIDPFPLQFAAFGGSGYDIACADAEQAIFYKKIGSQSVVEACTFQPDFLDQLYFVFLGKKQNSREGIQRYRKLVAQLPEMVEAVTAMTDAFAKAQTLAELEEVMEIHERFVAERLQLKRAKELYFNDFWGEVKSLGAWGGDFVLVTSNRPAAETQAYFNERDHDVFFKYDELILQHKN